MLKNILIVVNDLEKSVDFYKNLFCLDVILNRDGNVMMTEGLVLQDRKVWESFIQKEVLPKSNSCELFFIERDIERFVERLEQYSGEIEYVTKLMTLDDGQRMIRFYDLDGNLIEVRSI